MRVMFFVRGYNEYPDVVHDPAPPARIAHTKQSPKRRSPNAAPVQGNKKLPLNANNKQYQKESHQQISEHLEQRYELGFIREKTRKREQAKRELFFKPMFRKN